MKRILFLIMLCVCALSAHAQGGIIFTDNSYEELLKQAKQKGKHVFIDMYTEWCGPCKSMAKNVFPDSQAGAFYNKAFINAKINAEKEGKELAAKFNVTSYPTLLYISSEGELITKVIGMRSVDELIKEGQNSLDLLAKGDLLSNFETSFEKNKNNEVFLKEYITKKIELKEDPTEALEAYLAIQKEINPAYFEMMEFLIQHSKYFFCGSKGEEILVANMDEYMDIATKGESNVLKNMPFNIIMQTQKRALEKKDPALYELFLNRWIASPGKTQFQNVNDFRLQLLDLRNDVNAYVELGTLYLDSIQSVYTPERVKSEDKEFYDATCKRLAGGGGIIIEAIKKSSKTARTNVTLNIINTVGRKILSKSDNKKSLKKVIGWADYGLCLDNSNVLLMNLKADALKMQGKKTESTKLKNEIINSLPENDKLRVQLQNELTLTSQLR